MKFIALAGQELHGLEERQADDGGVGAAKVEDHRPRPALDAIASRLAAPFAAFDIGVDLARTQAFDVQAGFGKPAGGALRRLS